MLKPNRLRNCRGICWRSARGALALVLPAALLMNPGCSKAEIKEKLEQAQAKVEAVAESTAKAVEERLPATGSITLDMSKPVEEIKRAEVEVIVIGDGRPNVVQIVTYDPESEKRAYPCVLLHGTTSATSASGLSGETVACDMYFQPTVAGPIVMTKPGTSVSVTFRSINSEDNTLAGTLGGGELISSDNSPINVRSGDLVAVVKEGN